MGCLTCWLDNSFRCNDDSRTRILICASPKHLRVTLDSCSCRQLLTLSFGGMGLSMLAMAAGLYLPALAGYSGTIALVGTLAYVLSFALGAGPVPGLLVPEITPARIRGERQS